MAGRGRSERIPADCGGLRDLEADAVEAYGRAQQQLDTLWARWVELGCPAGSTGSTGQEVGHPLLKALNEAQVIADRLRERMRKGHRGPEPSAVIKPAVARPSLRKVE